MLKKRIIPCLDIQNGRTVKGVNFENIIDAGDPIALAKIYAEQGADELVFLDISATNERRKTLIHLLKQVAKQINIPFTVGGGISSVEDVKAIINAGADKVSINTSAVLDPNLITAIANEFGKQCVTVAVDTKLENNRWLVTTNGGKKTTNLSTLAWAKQVQQMGAGEILLTSMDNDGVKQGFAIDLLKQVTEVVNIPVIASGGAGNTEHFKTLFEQTNVSAALAASVFHFGTINLTDLKQYLTLNNIPIR